MVFVKFPLLDNDADIDLVNWRAKVAFAEGDWVDLKLFLSRQPRYYNDIHTMSKCWYSETPMIDNTSIDIEHFRPKNSAQPLNSKNIKKVENLVGYTFYQSAAQSDYKWLEFDYRNYRLVTAFTNRGGGKVDIFPVADGSNRLVDPECPWTAIEYNFLLDPTDQHDAAQLLVLPNGNIVPKAPKTNLSKADFDNYIALWRTDGFNYLRATITIIVYRLDYQNLIAPRAEVFTNTINSITNLIAVQRSNLPDSVKNGFIENLFQSLLPSAPFALAARSALESYIPSPIDRAEFHTLKNTLYQRLNNDLDARIVDWTKA